MTTVTSLGAFLKQRRSELTPIPELDHAAGVTRRVVGLRREEVARRANISVAYYTRLEQDRGHRASPAVLAALGRALRLDAGQTQHLVQLSTPNQPSTTEVVRPSTYAMIDRLSMFPAALLGRRADILAWNAKGHALLAAHLDVRAPELTDTRPNWARMLFLDEPTRRLYVDWYTKAEDTVADLHWAAARHRDDSELQQLIAELCRADADFAELWARRPVQPCSQHTRRYHHPTHGEIELDDQMLLLPDDPGQRLVLWTPTQSSSA